MFQIRKSDERGNAHHGWLKSKHTFSFAEYFDPRHMGFRALRVINEDRIDGGSGFPPHPHRDMEIISYVVKGALEHQDSMGNKTVIRPGEIQRMSAGTGVRHAEYNHYPDQETHFFQIWIQPSRSGLNPGYGQKSFDEALRQKNLVLVISNDGREDSIPINQDADLYLSKLKQNESLEFDVRDGRHIWLQMVNGSIRVNDRKLETGDALAIDESTRLDIRAAVDSEFMIFDLA
jgi:quercetin 2,3-dioxygenase